ARPEPGLRAGPELWRDGLWARAALAAVLGRRDQKPGDGAESDALYDAVEAVGAAPAPVAAAGEETR
ncbi:acyl-CoA dehydrogenase, partial [Streptomyces rhizosphaericola]